ncbi:hypothetical protein FOTG_10619 [Fusarium oxysporum f. sp. vasinfectum 25433]|uniref:Nephrocystin 3-like N-terminal domain-containing protein n=2 Tax=cellular organisms TaxID=131567 RepID=X0LKJ0_FUSOX|nr:hypothetical protein FOTG_10619 [Fusarium oxysporum f. sp. vasinfectum 25433]
MAASSHKNFRLRGIPLEYETRSEVCSLIQKTLALETNDRPTVYSLARSPTHPDSKIATLSFDTIPDCLSDRSKDEWSYSLSDGNDIDFGRSLAFDTHFTGFTPFHRTSDNDCNIDFIAVCGLGGHALGSFKEKNGRFVWLRDALPSDIPNARILTYGYNSQLLGSESFQSLTDLGRTLQVDLEDIRDQNQSRSIFFIGHSLGGLVIKETVRILKEEPLEPDYSILNAIGGFAFFGVPHRGLAVECLVPLVKDNPNRALLESLNKNSSLLERLQIEFDRISKAKSLAAVSFYETEKSPTAAWVNDRWEMSGPSEVLVEVFSATCGCQKQHPINRNHSEMVKYSGVHDQLYRRVIVALRPILGISRGRPGNEGMGGRTQVSVQLSNDEQECLKSLSFPEQEHRYSEISYASDTCDWLLEDNTYQKWMNKSRGLFWIKGCPGTGKSVLMKFAVDMMRRRKSGEIAVSFFVHGRGVPLQKTPLGMIRAVLNSLLPSFPTYLTELRERFQDQQQRNGSYEQKGGWLWNEKELEKFLARLLVDGTKDQQVVVFIDALDECGEEDAKRLLIYFKEIMDNAEREGSLVKICFSSRHFPILGHETISNIYVEQRNDEDIRLVVKKRLKGIKPDEKRQQIENEILMKAHGGFQWAVLVTNMVCDQDMTGSRTQDLFDTISSIPPGLEELYGVILKDKDNDQQKQMTKLFQWVLFACRPLSAQELRDALATDKDMTCTTISQLRSQGNWSDGVSQFEKRVRHISRGLVEFQDRDVYEQYERGGEEWSREAQFIHQSAADFVAQRFFIHGGEGSIPRSPSATAHYEISRSFLRYLTLDEVLHGSHLSREKLSAGFPLMPYGVAFLLVHIILVEEENIPQDDLVALIKWDQSRRLKMLASIWRIMDPESTHAPRGWPFVGATVLHLAIGFGSRTLLRSVLRTENAALDVQDSEGNTPLHLALREGRQDLAHMILRRSMFLEIERQAGPSTAPMENITTRRKYHLPYINHTNHDGETPMGLAVSIRAGKVILILIDAGAEIKHEKSLVFYAISTGDKRLLARLIKSDIDLEGAIFFLVQCLSQKHIRDDILNDLLVDLLQAGAGTSKFVGIETDSYDEAHDSDDEYEDAVLGDEAIFIASRHGRRDVVSLLLSYGSSAMVRNKYGNVPLLAAMANTHLETAEVLLQASPQATISQNNEGESVLDMVIHAGRSELARFLIEKGDGTLTLRSVFSQGIEQNAIAFMQDLLQNDEDMAEMANQSCEGEETPFWVALLRNHHHMVEILLHTGKIDTALPNRNGETPLLFAVNSGDVRMARWLLGTKMFDVSQEDQQGRTVLAQAMKYDDEYMVELLLSANNIDLTVQDKYGNTLFWLVIILGNLRIARLLLNTGKVDINQRGASGQTVFQWALEHENEEMVKLLLEFSQPDILRQQIRGQIPFCWVTTRRSYRMVKLLLNENGVDINQADSEGETPLWWAVQNGSHDILSLLLTSTRIDLHIRNKQGQTPCSWAMENEDDLVIQLLLDSHGFNIYKEDEQVQQMIFWWAVRNGNDRVVRIVPDLGRFDVNVKDESGWTMLMWAVSRCNESVVKVLLNTCKADTYAVDDEGDTALYIALQKGHQPVIDLLSRHMRSTGKAISLPDR